MKLKNPFFMVIIISRSAGYKNDSSEEKLLDRDVCEKKIGRRFFMAQAKLIGDNNSNNNKQIQSVIRDERRCSSTTPILSFAVSPKANTVRTSLPRSYLS